MSLLSSRPARCPACRQRGDTTHIFAHPPSDVAALLLDDAGIVVEANGPALALVGRDHEAVLGRDFFREIEPSLASPACRDRFLDLVQDGTAPAPITLTIGREAGSMRLSISMRAAGEPGLYLLTMRFVEALRPSRHREAMLGLGESDYTQSVDPTICESEPIQIPGTVQAPNGLLVIDPASLRIEAVSDSIEDLIGADRTVLGSSLEEALPPAVVAMIRDGLRDGAIPEGPPIRRLAILGRERRPFELLLHRRDGRLMVEIEPSPRRPADFGVPTHGAVRDCVAALRACDGLPALVDHAAQHLRALSGYDRLLIYRFDAEWNGEAVAEAIVPGWDASLLGLRFPASDIPRQARQLYTRSPCRFVMDRDAAPAPIVARPHANEPVDLTFAAFRSLSPVHLEYQRNLGVNGSMSISILVHGRLWGLVIGHHRQPHYVAPETRDALVSVTDAFALAIEEVTGRIKTAEQDAHLTAQAALLEQMAGADDVGAALSGETALSDLFAATGAAVVSGDAVSLIGVTPPDDAVLAFVDRLRQRSDIDATFASDNLASCDPAMAPYAGIAAGALVAFTAEDRRRALVWFRREIVRTVAWGGDPSKPLTGEGASAPVLPRRSFERWVETVRGRSRPWPGWKVDAARSLARAVDSMAARTTRRIDELSRKQDELIAALTQKDALLAEKDLLTREIDHRVKNSLQIVSAFLRMQARQVSDPEAQAAFEESYGRVMSIARVHDSLYQSDSVTEVDLGQTIEALCRDLSVMGGDRREIGLDVQRGLMVPYRKAVALCLIATELVTNAWKYAYPADKPGPVEIAVKHDGEGGALLTVRDQGRGMPTDWQENRKGLGMQLIRAMLGQIEARMEVVNDPGAHVTVTSG